MPLSILVVEDNRLIAFNLKNELESQGYSVSTVHSGSEAIKSVLTSKPDIVIMDVNLGQDEDGIDVMQNIQSKAGHIPNIYLTGYVREELSARTGVTSPLSVLEKPLDNKLLTKLLSEFEHK